MMGNLDFSGESEYEELFEDEMANLDLDGESEDEFESVGDLVDVSGSRVLVAGELLSPVSASSSR